MKLTADIDRTFWEVLTVDHGKLLRNAVIWATNEEPVVTVPSILAPASLSAIIPAP